MGGRGNLAIGQAARDQHCDLLFAPANTTDPISSPSHSEPVWTSCHLPVVVLEREHG
jgi:hypothetical protein